MKQKMTYQERMALRVRAFSATDPSNREALFSIGRSSSLCISMVWPDREIEVHSWEAVSVLTSKTASTLRVYRSRGILSSIQALNPYTGEWDLCEVTVTQEATRGRPEKELGTRAKHLTRQIEMTKGRIKIVSAELEVLQTKLKFLEASKQDDQ